MGKETKLGILDERDRAKTAMPAADDISPSQISPSSDQDAR